MRFMRSDDVDMEIQRKGSKRLAGNIIKAITTVITVRLMHFDRVIIDFLLSNCHNNSSQELTIQVEHKD